MTTNRKRRQYPQFIWPVIGVIGVVLIAASFFQPMFRIPLMGKMDYSSLRGINLAYGMEFGTAKTGPIVGCSLVALAVVLSFFRGLLSKRVGGLVPFTGALGLGMMWPWIVTTARYLSGMLEKFPQAEVDFAKKHTGLEAGGQLLFAGLLLMTVWCIASVVFLVKDRGQP